MQEPSCRLKLNQHIKLYIGIRNWIIIKNENQSDNLISTMLQEPMTKDFHLHLNLKLCNT